MFLDIIFWGEGCKICGLQPPLQIQNLLVRIRKLLGPVNKSSSEVVFVKTVKGNYFNRSDEY